MNITRPPPVIAWKREPTSCAKAWGRRAIIPIIMIIETPFPIPLSVILSPSHKINILPAARIIVAGIMKTSQEIPEANAWLAWYLRLIRYDGAWNKRIPIVSKRVYQFIFLRPLSPSRCIFWK